MLTTDGREARNVEALFRLSLSFRKMLAPGGRETGDTAGCVGKSPPPEPRTRRTRRATGGALGGRNLSVEQV
jgi:hypothetical protein